ncbi:MAG: ankyrin repeat domain-containing protein [Deltaproteobacteria bacterium]|nr:MAG: ankyrin repeat domain-containing protein [Deltaproteobacteria bacterium]
MTQSGAVATSQSDAEPSAELIGILLDAGADVNARTSQGNTPLHIAAYKGYAGTVRLLLARGAIRTARNAAGETPEALAQRYHQDAVVAIPQSP